MKGGIAIGYKAAQDFAMLPSLCLHVYFNSNDAIMLDGTIAMGVVKV